MKIADMHCDTLCLLKDNNLSINNNQTMVNLSNFDNLILQNFACFALYTENPYKRVCDLIETYNKILKENNSIIPVLTKCDLDKPGFHALLSIEEGGALEGKIERLDEFFSKGVRLITLTWNFKNEIGSPNNTRENIANNIDGLTNFGRELIKRMNDLGIVIDISHLGDASTLEVLALSTKPVVASHSGVRSICSSVRNLTDEMIKLLIQKRGFIGINFCKYFLNREKEEATIEDVIDHIDYIVKLGGIDVVGFGSDFDGISNHNIEMKNPSFFTKIIEALKSRGYTEEQIAKISYLNAFRVLNEVLN